MELKNTKKSFIKTVKSSKNENHLNISILRILAERIQLTNKDHWDSMMIVEENTKSLFTSDLFIQLGENKPISAADLSNR